MGSPGERPLGFQLSPPSLQPRSPARGRAKRRAWGGGCRKIPATHSCNQSSQLGPGAPAPASFPPHGNSSKTTSPSLGGTKRRQGWKEPHAAQGFLGFPRWSPRKPLGALPPRRWGNWLPSLRPEASLHRVDRKVLLKAGAPILSATPAGDGTGSHRCPALGKVCRAPYPVQGGGVRAPPQGAPAPWWPRGDGSTPREAAPPPAAFPRPESPLAQKARPGDFLFSLAAPKLSPGRRWARA